MNDKMMKMLMKKKKDHGSLSDSDKKSKLEALQGMRGMANSMMGDKLKHLKKVTVASDSGKGLKAGLHKAEDMLNKSDDDSEASMMNEGGSAYASGGMVDGHMPPAFDTDEQHRMQEAEDDNKKMHAYSDGGPAEGSDEEEASESPEEESQENDNNVDELVEEAPEDEEKLNELIQKLEEKKRSLQK